MRWLPLALLANPAMAQDVTTLDAHDLIAVAIEGSLNMRAGPTTDAERMATLPDGTILRRIGCLSEGDEDWCEIETIDGSTEGWASARFLVPWLGADPLALTSAAILPDQVGRLDSEVSVSGRLASGEILDMTSDIPADALLQVSMSGPVGVEAVVFTVDGTALAKGGPDETMTVVLPEGGSIIIRLADMLGGGGEWSLQVEID